jgi:hypothetical protein
MGSHYGRPNTVLLPISPLDRTSQESEASNGASRMTKATLWPRISGQGQRSEFRLGVFVLKVLNRGLRRSMSALLLGMGDFALLFQVARFEREKSEVTYQNCRLRQQLTKADFGRIEQRHERPV